MWPGSTVAGETAPEDRSPGGLTGSGDGAHGPNGRCRPRGAGRPAPTRMPPAAAVPSMCLDGGLRGKNKFLWTITFPS